MHPDDARALGPRRRRLRARHDRARRGVLKVAVERRAAARLAVRADPLERRDRLDRRASASWSRRTPIRSPASPKRRRRRPRSRRSTSRYRGFVLHAAQPFAPAGRARGGRASRSTAASASCSPPTTRRELWRERAPALFSGASSPNTPTTPRRLSRARVPRRDACTAACSSARPRRRRIGTPSRRCSKQADRRRCERRMLLSGRAADGIAETGPLICACFGVGLEYDPRGHRARRAHQRRGDRPGAARRHQLRLLPAGTEEDRRT